MQKSFLISKIHFKIFYKVILLCLIVPTLLSFFNNSLICDKRDYNYEISQYATYICNNPRFHKYLQGINLLYSLFISVIFVLPATSSLIITKLKVSNKLKNNPSIFHESNILFSSLPIREADIIRSCYINSFLYLLTFLFLFQSNTIISSFRTLTLNLNIASLNTFSLALIICSLIISIFIWIRFKSDGFSIFIANNWHSIFSFYPLIIILYFTNINLKFYLYNFFNSNSLFTNLIIGNSIPLFLLSILISFLVPYFFYKSIIKSH